MNPPLNGTKEGEITGERRHPSLIKLDKLRFVLMGIVNVTPDSFYDGGSHDTFEPACEHARNLINAGAEVVDIGGESSRPGSRSVSIEEELKRILPVIKQLKKETDVIISADTTKSAVAEAALDAGVDWINDISAGRFDKRMAALAAKRECPVVLTHSRKTPETMQVDPSYGTVVEEVIEELLVSVKEFTDQGVCRENIILDPGIGFAKRFEDNLEILRRSADFVSLQFPVLIGTSRKSFIGQITGKAVQQRLCGTLGSIAAAFAGGVKIFRVHDVEETRDFLSVLSTINIHT